jgi:hypothetical protein
MSSYIQWNRKRALRKVAWVCGPEAVLVREVVAAHREGAPPDQCTALFAGEVPERDIWDAVLADPLSGGRRITVYGAEKLKSPGTAALLAEDSGLDATCTVFVSASADFEREDGALVPHLAALQAAKAAQLIRCCEPSKVEDRTALVASWWPGATPNFAYDVLARCGSLERAYLACEQARLAGLQPAGSMAAAVCPADPGGELADLLMSGDKRAAMTVAGRVGSTELGAVIGLLASRLAAAEQIREGTSQGLPPREAAARERVDRFVASRVIPYLGAYGADRVRNCRRLLAVAEAAWRSGTRSGVAESLIALW